MAATITPTTIPVPTPSTSSPPTNPTVLESSLSESNKNFKSSDAPKASGDGGVELDDGVWEDADGGCDDDKNGEAIRAVCAQASRKVMDIQHDDGVDVHQEIGETLVWPDSYDQSKSGWYCVIFPYI